MSDKPLIEIDNLSEMTPEDRVILRQVLAEALANDTTPIYIPKESLEAMEEDGFTPRGILQKLLDDLIKLDN